MEIKKLLRTADHPFVSQQVTGVEIEYEESEAEAIAKRILNALLKPDPTLGVRRILDAACMLLMDATLAEEPEHDPIFRETDMLKRVWPEGSQPWYAQRIVNEARPLRDLLESGNADPWTVANLALSLGALNREAELSADLAAPAQSGMKARAGGKKGAARAHGDTRELYRQYVASFERLRAKGLSKMVAYQEAGKAHSVSYKTIAKAVTKK